MGVRIWDDFIVFSRPSGAAAASPSAHERRRKVREFAKEGEVPVLDIKW